MRVKLEGDVFFGEEMTHIKTYEIVSCGEKILVEIFNRDNGDFVIKRSKIERVDPDPNYDVIQRKEAIAISIFMIENSK